MKSQQKRSISKEKYLGDFVLSPFHFENLDKVVAPFKEPAYFALNHKEKSEKVNRALLDLIVAAPSGTFLLMAVLEYIDRILRDNILINYTFSSFELWLNQFSGLSQEENYAIRAKMMGKKVPRDEYQILFPIGMGKIHPGSHFVTAHASPDLDTTIASFWGWVDAFAAQVAEGIHIWNVPGGPPPSSIEVALLFHQIFGQNVFRHLAKVRSTLALSSLELMTQRGVLKLTTDHSSLSIDHERTQKAVILIDEAGYYLGDWRSIDVEGVRQVILFANHALRWLENHLQIKLVSLLAKEKPTLKDMDPFIQEMCNFRMGEIGTIHELTEKQQQYMAGYLFKVLKVEKGLNASFAEFAEAMKGHNLFDFTSFIEEIRALATSGLFDQKGDLIENRSKIFYHLQQIIALLDKAIHNFRLYTERLHIALDIKTQVFGFLPQVVSYRADVDELKSKMGNYPYLTVTSTDEEGKMLPLGVIRARDLQQTILGTVTLRDFCNRDETKVPSYFEVISVIDHHKATLQTSSAPVVYLSDAQSSNAVVADLTFVINDKYSLSGMELGEIEEQLSKLQKDPPTKNRQRRMQRLLQKLSIAHEQKNHPDRSFVDPLREFVEYLHFLYAIIDDTDLLTKISRRDVECVAKLLNRLKSLMEGQEVEIIHFDDLQQDGSFVERAASLILQHPDMYSLYRKIYLAKEQIIEENFLLAATGKESNLFADTKIQNGCCRVGQMKMFAQNYPSFAQHQQVLQKMWATNAQGFYGDTREVDLHLQMISTLAGAEDLYSGVGSTYTHKDQLWIWIPMTDLSIEHLKRFLNDFRLSPPIVQHQQAIEVHLIGKEAREFQKIFKESFLPLQYQRQEEGEALSMAIIDFPAGIINSRKAMISPYLPKLIS